MNSENCCSVSFCLSATHVKSLYFHCDESKISNLPFRTLICTLYSSTDMSNRKGESYKHFDSPFSDMEARCTFSKAFAMIGCRNEAGECQNVTLLDYKVRRPIVSRDMALTKQTGSGIR